MNLRKDHYHKSIINQPCELVNVFRGSFSTVSFPLSFAMYLAKRKILLKCGFRTLRMWKQTQGCRNKCKRDGNLIKGKIPTWIKNTTTFLLLCCDSCNCIQPKPKTIISEIHKSVLGFLYMIFFGKELFKTSEPSWKNKNYMTTFNGGSLGSCIDEERSKLRYVVRIAEFSESSNLWTQMALPIISRACLSESR